MKTLGDEDLDLLSTFAHRKWGLIINEKKRVIVENRLHSLRREYPVDSVRSLVDTIEQGAAPKLELALFDVLSTNHTSFFREDTHFDLLVDRVFKPATSQSKGLRLWSAGCSRGCEPYTLSILFQEVFGSSNTRDDRILATDLSTDALRAARTGSYTKQETDNITPDRLRTHFHPNTEPGGRGYTINDSLRSPISFSQLNLLDPWPMKGPFDAIMCRNVMIYFDRPTRVALAERFLKLLNPGGLLFVGTSETLSDCGLDVDPVCVGAYEKRGAGS